MTRTGLILAGGASRRFGRSKPLAALEGRPLVRWVADALASRCDDLLVSIGRDEDPGRFQEAVPGARIVRDAAPDRGPIEGLRRGCEAARGDVVLVAPSDAPFVRPELYDGLLALLGGHEAAVPRHEAIDPVRAAYGRRAVLRILERVGVPSPSALVDRLDAVFLSGERLRAVDPAGLSFIDVNRREDLDAAVRLAPSARSPSGPRHRY